MKSFSESGLKSELLSALDRINFIKPTPIQHKALDHLMSSEKDLIGLAHTGTGKTAAFALPILHRTHIEIKQVQTIVLCPTRELCLQITNDIEQYAKDLRHFKVVAVYGGASIVKQMNDLKRGCHMVVGTPGRTLDLIKRNRLKLNHVRWVVLDEADEMLSMGFKEDMDQILAETPKEKQTLLFSATMPKGIASLAQNYMTDPTKVSVTEEQQTTSQVSHSFYQVTNRDRFDTLRLIVDLHPNFYGIIFCRTRRETKEIAERMSAAGYLTDALHGDLNQGQRDNVMRRFRDGKIQLLIATDVAARGLDVNNLTHVINYNLPDELESYVHRSGRTGRAGNSGESICLLASKDIKRLQIIERRTGIRFEKRNIPSKKELISGRVHHFLKHLQNLQINEALIKDFDLKPLIEELILQMSKEELVAKLLTQELSDLHQQYKSDRNQNRNRPEKRESHSNSHRTPFSENQFARYYINLGSKHDVDPKTLISIINRQMRGDQFEIGKIEILKSFSFFEIEKGLEEVVISAFKKGDYEGHKLIVEKSLPKPTLRIHKKKKKGKKKKRAKIF
ncbi:MAG: DEAD/DEAH box helicase [Saprospiraceae bacterium]|nr:DEAD/DEAH box helicase [Saprospiraceae bacterium]